MDLMLSSPVVDILLIVVLFCKVFKSALGQTLSLQHVLN